MRWYRLGVPCLALFALTVAAARGQEYKIEPLKEAPPAGLAPAVAEALNPEGFRVSDGAGKAYADIWLRKSVPASGKPEGAKGAIQFPTLAEGELLGAMRLADEGHDYRDQSIPKGVYTMRYGLQPVNGDHLGVSPFRDYALLLPAAKDKELATLARKPLQDRSAESAGTSHPACLLLEKPGAAAPGVVHNEEKATWAVILPLTLGVSGSPAPVPLPVQLIVVGAAAA